MSHKIKLSHQRIKKSCREECNKTKKILPLMMDKLGKTTGLTKEEIEKRIKEHDKYCEKNCIHLMKDKKIMNQILKSVKKNHQRKRTHQRY